MRPKSIHGPGEQQAVVDYLQGCGIQVLDSDWRGPNGQLDVVAVEHDVLVVFDIRTPPKRVYQPLHEITRARRRRLRLLAAAWLTAHDKRFDQIRLDGIGLDYGVGGYTIEHVRDVG